MGSTRLLVLALAALCVTTAASFDVIFGTPGGTTAIDDTFTQAGANALSGTTLLMGALNIKSSFCSNSNFPSSADKETVLATALGAIREIHDSLQVNIPQCVSNLDFLGELRVIHGLDTTSGGFALFINTDSVDVALRTLGLKSLTRVMGNIKVDGGNSAGASGGLCGKANTEENYDGADFALLLPGTVTSDTRSGGNNARTVTTSQGGTTYTAVYVEDRKDINDARVCTPDPFCHASCTTGKCWAPNDATACQRVCLASCGLEGCNPSGACCPSKCLGGCDASGECYACGEGFLRRLDGSCAATCAAGTSAFGEKPAGAGCGNAVVQEPFVCLATCPTGTSLYEADNMCVSACPTGASSGGVCAATSANGIVVCPVVGDLVCRRQLLSVAFSSCNAIGGSLRIVKTSDLSTALQAEKNILKKIRFIGGVLSLYQTEWADMSPLQNLEVIGYDPASNDDGVQLVVVDNQKMERLGLNKLRTITATPGVGGGIDIIDNTDLCFYDTIDFDELMAPNAAVFDNYIDPVDPGSCTFTDYQVKSSVTFTGVNSSSLTTAERDAAEAAIEAALGGNELNIDLGTATDNGSGDAVVPITVKGIASNLLAVTASGNFDDNLVDPPLIAEVPAGAQFAASTTHSEPLEPCNEACGPSASRRGCWGPGEFACQICPSGQVLRDGACVTECNDGDPSPAYHVSTVDSFYCSACDVTCGTCSDKFPTDCLTCPPTKVLRDDGTCSSTCPNGQYVNATTATCADCDTTCLTCSGPGTQLCESCPSPNHLLAGQCVAECPAGTVEEAQPSGVSECVNKQTKGGSSAGSSSTAAIGAGAGGGVALIILIAVIMLVIVPRMRQSKTSPYVDAYGNYGGLVPIDRAVGDEWEIDRRNITVGKIIGAGHFGQVHKALFVDPAAPEGEPALDVAVKVLKNGAQGTNEEREFYSEMKLMKEIGFHQHVISMVGCCTMDLPLMLVVEFADHGDLQGYLRSRRAKADRPAMLNANDFVNFSVQIAHGMQFLSNLKIIHRDLATRNVLVCSDTTLKVSDFGLAKDVYEEDFYQKQSGGTLPFKWMAPECLIDRVFTTASDVWSFGVTMWEIYQFGGTPYPTVQNHAILDMLKAGYRMPRPDMCPEDVYTIMVSCWEFFGEARPTFEELVQKLAEAGGIDVSEFDNAQPPRWFRGGDDDAYEMPVLSGDDSVNSSGYLSVNAPTYDNQASDGTMKDISLYDNDQPTYDQGDAAPEADIPMYDMADGPPPGTAAAASAVPTRSKASQKANPASYVEAPTYDQADPTGEPDIPMYDNAAP